MIQHHLTTEEFVKLAMKYFSHPNERPNRWKANFAAHYGLTSRSVRSWASGARKVPSHIAAALNDLAKGKENE